MIYIIYIQRFTSVHLNKKFDLIFINLYNLHLHLLIHLSYVLYSASICHAGITAIEIQFLYYYYVTQFIASAVQRRQIYHLQDIFVRITWTYRFETPFFE